jgi:hypothetical protein
MTSTDTHRPVNIADDAAFLDYDATCAHVDAQLMLYERRLGRFASFTIGTAMGASFWAIPLAWWLL